MRLISASVGPFRSISIVQDVNIDEKVTVLVGMNEAGKTIFLQALQKSRDAIGSSRFEPVEDYPRKDLPGYLKRHDKTPDTVVNLMYRLTAEEVRALNAHISGSIKSGFEFSVIHKYDNNIQIDLHIDESPIVRQFVDKSKLSSDAKRALKNVNSFRKVYDILNNIDITDNDRIILSQMKSRVDCSQWPSVVAWEAYSWLKPRIPRFLYFSEYELLPSKINLADLKRRIGSGSSGSASIKPEYSAVQALLWMADISIDDFTNPDGYESLKAKLEGISINLTDQIMEFWKQNENLDVEVDINDDPNDDPPFNNGPNLYLRIKDRRHRGVSTPFRQRSRGFIWFFSFLVWFNSVQRQVGSDYGDASIILLLDEPGLSLHAKAQENLLDYIDQLAERHQVLYTTHSPFMVRSDRLKQVRVIEDQKNLGTVISDNVSGSDSRTLFPLQAALGYTIAQNLFITKRNLLVEGPSDLIYLKSMSSILESMGRIALRKDVTIVPAGGLDKVVTFVALLGANDLRMVVLHDYRGIPEQKLNDLTRQKIISEKNVLSVSQFRNVREGDGEGVPADIEDLFAVELYLECFNKTFIKQLKGVSISENDIPSGDRIIDRIERYMKSKGIQLRTSGGFNHFSVASHFASNQPSVIDPWSLNCFEKLFKTVNKLLSS